MFLSQNPVYTMNVRLIFYLPFVYVYVYYCFIIFISAFFVKSLNFVVNFDAEMNGFCTENKNKTLGNIFCIDFISLANKQLCIIM